MNFKYLLMLMWGLVASILAFPINLDDVTSMIAHAVNTSTQSKGVYEYSGDGDVNGILKVILSRTRRNAVKDEQCPINEKRLPFKPPLNICVPVIVYENYITDAGNDTDDYIDY